MKSRNLLPVYVGLSITILVWGLSFVITKDILSEFTVYGLLLVRFGSASFIFLIIMLIKGLPDFDLKEHGLLIITAIFQPGLYFFFETMGLKYTTASKAGLIIGLIPVAVLFASSVFYHEKITLRSLFGMMLSVLGVSLLIVGDLGFKWTLGGNITGDLFLLGAVFSAVVYTLLVKKLTEKHSAFEVTSLQIVYGTLLFIPVCFYNIGRPSITMVSGSTFLSLLFLVVFSTVLAFLFFNFALTRISPSKASVFTNLVPAITVISGWVFLDESLSVIQIGGGVAILMSIWLVNHTQKPKIKIKPVALDLAS